MTSRANQPGRPFLGNNFFPGAQAQTGFHS